MKVLIAAAIFGISFGMYGCSNEAKFAGRPMAATEAPASSPGAAIQTTADANPSGVTSTGATITTTTGTTAGTTTIVTGNTGGTTTTGTTAIVTGNTGGATTTGTATVAIVPSNWVDVTTTNGTMPSTCNATPANCTMKDTISGLKWSNRRPDGTWQGAIDHCRALTYNGVSGWRLPTKDELVAANTNGIFGAAKEGWKTASDMNAWFWSSSSSFTTPGANGDTNGAWYVFLSSGSSNHSNSGYSKSANLSVVCVQ